MSLFEATFRFARAYSPLALLALAVALSLAGWWSLRREAPFLARRNHVLLAVLRVAGFLLLIFLLMKPILIYQEEASLRQHVILLLDESESMNVADKVLSRIQLESAANVLGLRTERAKWPPPPQSAAFPSPDQERSDQAELRLSQAAVQQIKSTTRAQLVRRALQRDQERFLDQLRKDYILDVYAFADRMRDIPFPAAARPATVIHDLAATGPSTRIGAALQRIVQDYRGQPVAGVVLISDGRNLAGVPPLSVADVAGDARIPIFTVPVGAGGSRDLAVAPLICEPVVFRADEFPVSAKIVARGYGGYIVPVALECNGVQVETKQVKIAGREQLVTFRYKRDQEGAVRIRVSVPPQEAEETADNNAAETVVRVIDKKIKVLMVEEIPRWDFRYLSNTLFRDPHIDCKVYLQQADRQVVAADPRFLPVFPATEKELFEFDLIILGTLRPKFLREDQLAMIERFVSKMGGGLIFMAGENISPSLWAGSLLEPLLPVRITGEPRPWLDPDRLEIRSMPRKLELSDEGRRHNITLLEAETDRNERVWRDFPPHYWVAEVGGLRPAAQTLVLSVGTRDGTALPAVAFQPYGLGRVLYVGIDSTWQLRYKVGDRYFVRFWTQAVQFLTLSRLLGQNKRLQIAADRDIYEVGQTASLSVRALDATFQPKRDENILIAIEEQSAADQAGKRHEIRAFLEPDREGVYSAVFKIPYEGRFAAIVQDGADSARVEFEAKRARMELQDPEADWAAMAQIANRSGGRVVTLDNLDQLLQLLSRNKASFVGRREQPLWDWWPFLAMFVFVKSLELALRKYWHLK